MLRACLGNGIAAAASVIIHQAPVARSEGGLLTRISYLGARARGNDITPMAALLRARLQLAAISKLAICDIAYDEEHVWRD